MKIKLDLKVFIFLCIFFFTNQLEIYVLGMIFALLHELGHILVGRLCGYKLKVLNIMPIGFSIVFKPNFNRINEKIVSKAKKDKLNKIIIAIAGPFTNIIIVLISMCLDFNFKNEVIYINAIIAIFNLMPIYPLDGIKVIENIFKLFEENEKAYKKSNRVSNGILIIITIFLVFLIIYEKNIAIFLILLYLWTISIKQNKMQKIRQKVYNRLKITCQN